MKTENGSNLLEEVIGSTDIYLVDQIMKGRYKANDIILDAGCGYGRNLHWFLRNDVFIYGIDQDGHAIRELQLRHPAIADRFRSSEVEQLPFEHDRFDHIISSAVLHFARDTAHFRQMIAERLAALYGGRSHESAARVHPFHQGTDPRPRAVRRTPWRS